MLFKALLALAGLVATARGHAAVTHPKPRQAIEESGQKMGAWFQEQARTAQSRERRGFGAESLPALAGSVHVAGSVRKGVAKFEEATG